VTLLGLVMSVLPFLTVPFDIWMERTHRLEKSGRAATVPVAGRSLARTAAHVEGSRTSSRRREQISPAMGVPRMIALRPAFGAAAEHSVFGESHELRTFPSISSEVRRILRGSSPESSRNLDATSSDGWTRESSRSVAVERISGHSKW
jgi:hypothetical protein